MKNTILIISLIMVCRLALGQSVTTSPAVFTAEDEVTITVDVSGTSLAGYTGDVWIWSWIEEGCSLNCDAPTNIDPAGGENTDDAKMTRVEGESDVYSITIIPSAFYGKSPAELKKLGIKLKSLSWGDNKQSDNNVFINVQPLVYIPSQNRNFPVKFTTEDLVTFYFDQSLAENQNMKALTEVYAYIFVSGIDTQGEAFSDVPKVPWGDVGNTPELMLQDEGEGIFSISFIPNVFFPLEEGDEINKISYIFRNANGDVQTATFEAFPLSLN